MRALRTQKFSRFVSTMKCLISSVAAAGETHCRRNHRHSRSIAACAENLTGQARLPARMSVTATRDTTRIHG